MLLNLGEGGQRRYERIEATNASPSMKNSPCDVILDQKMKGMKFYKYTIIICKAMNRFLKAMGT
jgi:hypothetical protein